MQATPSLSSTATPRKTKLIRRFAMFTAFALAGLLMFAVVVFALAFYASEDAKRLSAYYQQLQPLQLIMEQQGEVNAATLSAALPSTLHPMVNVAPNGVIHFSLGAIQDVPSKFRASTLIITPKRETKPWQWTCVYADHPDWQTYVPMTCANAQKPPTKPQPH